MTSLPGINVLISQCLWILIIIQSGINKPHSLPSYPCPFVFQDCGFFDILLISDFYFLTRPCSFSHELGFMLSVWGSQEIGFFPNLWTPESLGSAFPVITSGWVPQLFAWCSEHPGKKTIQKELDQIVYKSKLSTPT